MAWPEHYPKSCPPYDSEKASGDVFRYVNNPPDPKDLTSHWFLYKNLRETTKKAGLKCQLCGISVFRSLADLKDAGDLCPNIKKNNKVAAEASLSADMGKIKHTPSLTLLKHHTWWIPVAITKPHKCFSVVA